MGWGEEGCVLCVASEEGTNEGLLRDCLEVRW